nr:hypothetical protein CFP56_26341 [Quercus suber]
MRDFVGFLFSSVRERVKRGEGRMKRFRGVQSESGEESVSPINLQAFEFQRLFEFSIVMDFLCFVFYLPHLA